MRFRFIDRVVEFKSGERAKLVTAKTFPESYEFIEGHPHRPGEVPTCLVLESLATSGVHLVFSHTSEQFLGVLLKVDVAEILSPVYAGDEIMVHTELLAFQPKTDEAGLARTRGDVFVKERLVAKARLVLLCFPRNGFEGSAPW